MGNEEVQEAVACSLCNKVTQDYMRDFLYDNFYACRECLAKEAGEDN